MATLLALGVPGVLRAGEIRVDGVRSPLLEGGSRGAEEAVVFVHGNPGSSRDWVDLAAAVSAFARVTALDMPGFGRADRPKTFEYTVEGYARHLARALDVLGIRRAHLVLHDFGGAWGLAWAAAHADAFRSATLINTGILPGYRWHYLARIWRTPLLGELFMATATRTGFRLLLRHGNPRGVPPALVDRMYSDFDTGARRAVLRLYRATDPRRFGELGPPLRRLHRPALVVWGAHDPYLPVAYASRQREVFPDARVVVLDGSGHWPFADDPRAVAAAVVPFLRERLGAATAPSPPVRAKPPERTNARRAPTEAEMKRDHAIVVGASMGGLLAARVLSNHFAHVTILERDPLPEGPEVRKGVSQGAHLHVLLEGGRRILDGLFPDLRDALRGAGAVQTEIGSRFAWHQFGVWKTRSPVGVTMWQQTRPLLEHLVRTRVAARPNIAFRTSARVAGLLATGDGSRVSGVRLATPDASAPEEVRADFVVDASGRGSRAAEWLEALGLARVDEQEVRMWLGYSTRVYRRTTDPGWNACMIIPTPPALRGGALFAVEGGRWMCTLSAFLRDYPPTDEAEFMAFARDLAVPDLHEVIRDAEPLGEIRPHRFASSMRRRFERLRGMPEGFVVMGDALSSFNPIYGQGMTVSAIEAEALDACLRNGANGQVTAHFQRHAARIVDAAWTLAATEDLRYPAVEGARPPFLRALHAYVERAHRMAARDEVVMKRLCAVLSMIAPPAALFGLATAVRVLGGPSIPRRAPLTVDPAGARKGRPAAPKGPREPGEARW